MAKYKTTIKKELNTLDNKLKKAILVLGKACHAPGCKDPEECPEKHEECEKHLDVSTAVVWELRSNLAEAMDYIEEIRELYDKQDLDSWDADYYIKQMHDIIRVTYALRDCLSYHPHQVRMQLEIDAAAASVGYPMSVVQIKLKMLLKELKEREEIGERKKREEHEGG